VQSSRIHILSYPYKIDVLPLLDAVTASESTPPLAASALMRQGAAAAVKRLSFAPQ